MILLARIKLMMFVFISVLYAQQIPYGLPNYFKIVENRALDRIKGPAPVYYEGNMRLRNLVSRFANLNLIGNFTARILTLFLSADLFLRK